MEELGYKGQQLVAAAFFLVALLIIGINMLCRVVDSHKYDAYEYTVGKVIKYTTSKMPRSGSRGSSYSYKYSITVEYQVDGTAKPYTIWDEDSAYEFFRQGKLLRVYYDEDDPKEAYLTKEDPLTGLYLPAEKQYYIPFYVAVFPALIGVYLIFDYEKAKKLSRQNKLKPKKKVKSSEDPDYDPNLHELARMSNYKRGWVPFWICGSLFYLFTMFAGIMIIYTAIKDHPKDYVSSLFAAGFFMILGNAMLGGVIISIFYLKRKKNAFLNAFMMDEATAIYTRREEAALTLWGLVKKYMEKETPWGRFKLEYNRDWLETYEEELTKYK